jgi:hypothetical protein
VRVAWAGLEPQEACRVCLPSRLDSNPTSANASVNNAPRRVLANSTIGMVTMVARSRKQCQVTNLNGL